MSGDAKLNFGSTVIGAGAGTLLVAEVGLAHEGSIGLATSFIDLVCKSGFDAVKFQMHIAEAESTLDEELRVPLSFRDTSRFDYWKRTEFKPEEWVFLKAYAEDKGLIFILSVFSREALIIAEDLNLSCYKIGSGEFFTSELVLEVFKTSKPVLISTGMSTWSEINTLVEQVVPEDVVFGLMQCTSKYPSSPATAGINLISEFSARYGQRAVIGFSDHSGDVFSSLLAMAWGARIIEVHVTFDRQMFGPDASSSLEFQELLQIANFRDMIDLISSNPVDKDKMADEVAHLRTLFTKSVALKRDVKCGELLTEDLLCLKKPGHGLKESSVPNLIGKRVSRDVPSNRLLSPNDVEDYE